MPDPKNLPEEPDIEEHNDTTDYFTCDKCGKESSIRAGICVHCGDAYTPGEDEIPTYDPATRKGAS